MRILERKLIIHDAVHRISMPTPAITAVKTRSIGGLATTPLLQRLSDP